MEMTVTLAQVIERLNSMVVADPDAMRALVEHRVPCNRFMADHPTAQVGRIPGSDDTDQRRWQVGMLGVLNGILGTQGEGGPGYLAASMDVDCPNGCDTKQDKVCVDDPCPHCGTPLVLGRLVEFCEFKIAKTGGEA